MKATLRIAAVYTLVFYAALLLGALAGLALAGRVTP